MIFIMNTLSFEWLNEHFGERLGGPLIKVIPNLDGKLPCSVDVKQHICIERRGLVPGNYLNAIREQSDGEEVIFVNDINNPAPHLDKETKLSAGINVIHIADDKVFLQIKILLDVFEKEAVEAERKKEKVK
ncbi:MAG TPA: hypothetical protein PK950_00360 [Candidatus Paceibacterota bacterium]|nr:hypothetical protein [Candidatus Paceibacterota bacterium]